jgi:antitoxin ParD1/3/4
MLVENHEAEEAAKLQALRAAAQTGAAAIERGEFKEFADASALVVHLNAMANAAIYGSGDNRLGCVGR